VLDGVPENVALGVSMDGGGLVLLVAIAVGNTPEAIGSGAYLRTEMSMARRRGMLLWAGTGAVLVLATVAADAAAGSVGPASISAIQAFAGGATVAVLADTLMPEAYKQGGWWVGLATALGFLVAFALG
jgi:ZIP family zinc transporter